MKFRCFRLTRHAPTIRQRFPVQQSDWLIQLSITHWARLRVGCLVRCSSVDTQHISAGVCWGARGFYMNTIFIK